MIPLRVEPSLTLALLGRVREMRAAGEDVASFAAGEPDFETPEVVVSAAISSMKKGDTRYVATPGVDALREAIARDYRERLGAGWVKKDNVLVSAGAKQGIYLTLMALLDAGDEVLIPSPYWVSYPHIVHAAEGVMKEIKTQQKNDFFPTVKELDAAWTPKTKALIFSSPGNPTGCMIKKSELEKIVQWCVKKKVTLMYDEIYERLALTDLAHVCPLSLVTEKESEYIASMNAFSKSMAMTGWRLGYIVTHKANISALSSLHGQMLTSLPGFIQAGAMEGLKHADDFLRPVIKSYQKRLQLMTTGLEKIKDVSHLRPTGAFYVCADVSQIMKRKKIKTDVEFAELLLKKEKVVVLPGSSMGMDGWLRFSFATNEAEIKKGLERFKRFCEG